MHVYSSMPRTDGRTSTGECLLLSMWMLNNVEDDEKGNFSVRGEDGKRSKSRESCHQEGGVSLVTRDLILQRECGG